MQPAGEGRPQRLVTLDAMRGIAAVCVLLFHMKLAYFDTPLMDSGYLAVDFFFLLSGYVLAATYDRKLLAGMTFGRFAAVRVIRVYPLYVIGFAIALLRFVGQFVAGRLDEMDTSTRAISMVLEFALIPSPVRSSMFMMNEPAWSLFFELLVNAFYAMFLVHAGPRALALLAVLFAEMLVATALQHGSLGVGWTWVTFHSGIARVGFSFVVGMLMARALIRAPEESHWALVPMVILLAVLVVPVPAGLARISFDLIFVLVLGPVLLWFGATSNPVGSLRPIGQTLGDISYPMYIVHFPLIWVCGYAAKVLGLAVAVWVPAAVLAIAGLAWALNRFWDVPVRGWLSKRMTGGAERAGIAQGQRPA